MCVRRVGGIGNHSSHFHVPQSIDASMGYYQRAELALRSSVLSTMGLYLNVFHWLVGFCCTSDGIELSWMGRIAVVLYIYIAWPCRLII